MKRWLPTAAIVVVVDQLTKAWAQRALRDRVIDLPGPSALRLSYNTGVAFGQGRGWGIGPIVAALAMVIIAILVIRVARHASARRQLIVGLVIGGAAGNLIDRVTQSPGWFRGPVVDFIQLVPWFPIFNVADMAITLGGIALVIAMANESGSASADTDSDTDADTDPDTHTGTAESDSDDASTGDGSTGDASTGDASTDVADTGAEGEPAATHPAGDDAADTSSDGAAGESGETDPATESADR